MGPTVTRVYPVDAAVLAVEIVEGRIQRGGQETYVPQAGDTLVESSDKVLAWDAGQPALVPKNIQLRRKVEGQDQTLGYLLKNHQILARNDIRLGSALNVSALTAPASYRLTAEGDAHYAGSGLAPIKIDRKSKPIDENRYGGGQSVRHVVYLQWPHALVAGVAYRLGLPGLNTQETEISYRHLEPLVWNECIHVNQVGYHPGDDAKHGLLSLWKGTGGGHDFDSRIGQPFRLVDVLSGRTVFTGTIAKTLAATQADGLLNQKNNAQTALYSLDFSAFTGAGRFRLEIDGLGCSYPFTLARDTWLEAFRVSLLGFLHHRSGVELGPPFTKFQRPLTFHPEVGTRLLQTDVMTVSGEADVIRESLTRLAATAPDVPAAWGGYMDAGDWDRRSQHLEATYLHLELFDLFSDYFATVPLSLPPAEAANAIPDLLDEALWNIDFYHRLQRPDGAVRGGVESTEHPRSGEASWQESLLVGVFAADAVTSYRFAATAAKAARLLPSFAPAKSADLASAATAAWNWAEANRQTTLDGVSAGQREATSESLRKARATAAVELHWLTSATSFHAAFQEEVSTLGTDASLPEKRRDSLFTYARLPAALADPSLQQKARQAVLDLAEKALQFQAGNPFGLATDNRFIPMMGYTGYFSVPGMVSNSLPRAHALTGDPRFLRGAVRACNFANGANPDNLVYTTGLGSYFPTSPLHIDSRVTAQPTPVGITIYGPSDPAAGYDFNEWVHVWRLKGVMVPDSRTWPAAESHVNLFDWPGMSEYTVHQNLGPTSYHWGYLAGQAAHPPGSEPGVGLDSDQDGLEDAVEWALLGAYSGDRFQSLADIRPEDDFDRDGESNLQEFLAGSDLGVAGMGRLYFSLLNGQQPHACFLQGATGPFQLQSSPNLRQWTPLGEPFDHTGQIHWLPLAPLPAQAIFLRVHPLGN